MDFEFFFSNCFLCMYLSKTRCDLVLFFLLRFDELHYGKYAGLYMQNTFFFDSQPPFGKQLVALAAYIAGFDGEALSLLWHL